MFNGHPRLRAAPAAVAAAIHALDDAAARQGWRPPAGELSIAILTEAALARLHADFLADPSPTDVITFPGDPAHGTAGEICISADRARAVAERRGLPPGRELALYLLHGWLHLAGFDDRRPEDRRAMRAAERLALAELDAAEAIPTLGPAPG